MKKDINRNLKNLFPLICKVEKPTLATSEDGERTYSWSEYLVVDGCKTPNIKGEKILSREGWVLYEYSYLLNGNFDITEDMRLVEDNKIYDIKKIKKYRKSWFTVLLVKRIED